MQQMFRLFTKICLSIACYVTLGDNHLWKQVLTRDGITNIIQNYAQIVETKDEKAGRKRREQIWPRYHQLDVVRKLLADASSSGVGPKYLIQHSAGSGKSNSIAWLAHQLIGLEREDDTLFDSVIIVTDRRVLDKQIRDTVRQFAQVGSVVGHAETSGHLRTLLQEGKRIVITTVQKFPFILDAIGNEHRGRTFAIIIDEAHSSQGGRTSASVSMALREAGNEEEEETTEDKINRLMESKKLLPNASYFAFTATPKNKTLEIFGAPVPEGGKTRHVPFHSYAMKRDNATARGGEGVGPRGAGDAGRRGPGGAVAPPRGRESRGRFERPLPPLQRCRRRAVLRATKKGGIHGEPGGGRRRIDDGPPPLYAAASSGCFSMAE